jgi:hypothetical protein
VIKLFSIPLRGAGTSEVESFASYIHRIAFEHGLFVGELLRYIYKNSPNDSHFDVDVPDVPKYVRPGELLRPSRLVDAYVRMTGAMTSQNLRQSSLWFLDEPLGRSANEVVKGFRWCPECFEEMLVLGDEPYFKLVWHLSVISHCPHHKTPLVSNCQFCGCGQTSYRKQCLLVQCQKCGENLSSRKIGLVDSDIEPSWEASGNDVFQLLGDLSVLPVLNLPKDGVARSLSDVFDYYWRTERDRELYRLIDRDLLLRIIEHRQSVSLKVARRLAYRLGVSLYALLSGEAANSSLLLNPDWVQEFPPGFAPVEHKKPHDHAKIVKALRGIVEGSFAPPSKKQVALQLGVSIGYLEYRFAALMARIVKNHHDLAESERLHRKLQARRAALEYFVAPKYELAPKSRKQAYKILRQDTGLPKFMLKEAIKDAYSAVM